MSYKESERDDYESAVESVPYISNTQHAVGHTSGSISGLSAPRGGVTQMKANGELVQMEESSYDSALDTLKRWAGYSVPESETQAPSPSSSTGGEGWAERWRSESKKDTPSKKKEGNYGWWDRYLDQMSEAAGLEREKSEPSSAPKTDGKGWAERWRSESKKDTPSKKKEGNYGWWDRYLDQMSEAAGLEREKSEPSSTTPKTGGGGFFS